MTMQSFDAFTDATLFTAAALYSPEVTPWCAPGGPYEGPADPAGSTLAS
jgi:hypothetical protein